MVPTPTTTQAPNGNGILIRKCPECADEFIASDHGNHFCEECRVEISVECKPAAVVRCLKCQCEFYSHDRCRNRICGFCDGTNTGLRKDKIHRGPQRTRGARDG